MENRRVKSTAPLLRLAPEILDMILSYIHADSLGNLALVNSDCRQLARSRQFHSIRLDYSGDVVDIVRLLLEEKALRDRSDDDFGGIRGAIGPFIRRLTCMTDPRWITHRFDLDLSAEVNAREGEVKEERPARTSDAILKHMKDIEDVLAALPHLESLDWDGTGIQIQPSFFQALVTSNIQHLRLSRATIDHEFEVIQPPPSRRWNLRTLDMHICWHDTGKTESTTSPLCTSLLQSCSHSLETLVWGGPLREDHTFGSDPSKIPQFPKLKNLRLSFVRFADINTVERLLEPSLRVLNLMYNGDSLVRQVLGSRGEMRSLETLVLSWTSGAIDNYLSFLNANPQICKLSFTRFKVDELSKTEIEDRIIPILPNFKNLTSLRLAWDESCNVIPSAALQTISRLQGLEQVCLSAGHPVGWRRTWLIDHDLIRTHLSKLPNLIKIALARDTYIYWSDLESYYSMRVPIAGDYNPNEIGQADDKALAEAWEAGHKRRMVLEAEKYAASMPKLEWIFLGEYPMAITRGGVAPLCEERDSCRTLLDKMFGWDGFRG